MNDSGSSSRCASPTASSIDLERLAARASSAAASGCRPARTPAHHARLPRPPAGGRSWSSIVGALRRGAADRSWGDSARGRALPRDAERRHARPLRRGRPRGPASPATVAVEDRRFYQHGGVDYVGIARALWTDINAGKVVQGGSTITQQLVRNLYIGQERTFDRKLKEACLAIKLAGSWSKQKILHEYLNTVYYGNHAYGVEAAAQTYFSEHASELTLPQAALLAGLPQAPSVYDPFHNP